MKNKPPTAKKNIKSNRKIIVTSIIFIFIVAVAGIFIWYRYFLPEEKEFAESEYPVIEYEDIFSKTEELVSPSPSLFEGCIEADSAEEYEEKKGYEIEGEVKQIESPKYFYFPVKFYLIPVSTGFEQNKIDTVFMFDIKFCELSENNWQILASPLKRENVLDYLIFRKVKMSIIEANQNIITIFSDEDYQNAIRKFNDKFNENIDPKENINKSTVIEEKDKYIVDWAYYFPDELEVKLVRITILKNGIIAE